MISVLREKETQHHLTRAMQTLLLALSAFTFYAGDTTAFVNSLMSFLITFLPGFLERKYDLTLDTGLALWITAAVFFHTVGAVSLAGSNLYNRLWWWDHFTHTLSASVVAVAGYITLRSFDEHYEDIHIPGKYLSVFILVFVMAFGVIWELIEFALSGLSKAIGSGKILTQYGVEDTMKDLLFDTVGGLTVALFGQAYLNHTFDTVKEKLGEKIYQVDS
jgi:hypothetical protein